MKPFFFITLFLCCALALSEQCTNDTPYSSHTFRAALQSSTNVSWKEEISSHFHLTPTDTSAWSNLLPSSMLNQGNEASWAILYKKMKFPNQFNASGKFIKEASLHEVRLHSSSFHWRAQQTNLEYLLMLDVDRLVWSFRKTAGLPTPGKAYGGWESSTWELRGHFVGHYLSASAHMWASTHNDSLKGKMSAVVSALSACQKKLGTGYLSAFPSTFFDTLEALERVWAPYYTIHKILAGLLDQYTYANNSEALIMTKWMVKYFYYRVQNVIIKYSLARHWSILNDEFGGMNDVLYRLFTITKDPRHLLMAHLFDKPLFLGALALQFDYLFGFHANTHIPIVVGAQMRYEVTADPLYKVIGTFFMDVVNSSHSYATGGTSVSEFWSIPKRMASTLGTENEESCTTYNMLKVSRHLFTWTKEMAYADYYERALTNGVLSIQRGTEPGVMIYMLPLGRGVSKARTEHGWGTKFNSFWCCYGTGIESFSKLGDSIYFEEEGEAPGVYIIQYISSSLNWKTGRIVLNQIVNPVVSWDPYLRITLTFSSKKGAAKSSVLNLRIPIWTDSNGANAALNEQSLSVPAPGKFLSITKKWSSNDKLTLELPIKIRTEAIKDDRPAYASVQAILYGPYLLAGHTSGDWDIKRESGASLLDLITPIPRSHNAHLVTFLQEFGKLTLVLTNSNHSIIMGNFPQSGTDSAVQATFRLILENNTCTFLSLEDAIGQSVMLEPVDFPGMLIAQQGDGKLVVTSATSDGGYSIFRLIVGLDRRAGSVSLESKSQRGCFISSGVNLNSRAKLKIRCKTPSSEAGFDQSASFVMKKGLSVYHDISFVAKGVNRNFLLAPLLSLRDESYTVYFNFES